MAIIHHHPHGPQHVLSLYGEDGLDFHLSVAHEVHDSGEMDEHEQDVLHINLHVAEDEDSGDEDHLVDPELLADAIGPVPLEEFYLRTTTCPTCAILAIAPIGADNAARIREHVLAFHAHQVVLPSGDDDSLRQGPG